MGVSPDDKRARRDSGPLVRRNAVTGGRTEPVGDEVLDLVDVVVASDMAGKADDDLMRYTPEHRKILDLCQRPTTIADIAADTTLPAAVVRALLADLILQGTITVVRSRPAAQLPGNDVLKEILDGLRGL